VSLRRKHDTRPQEAASPDLISALDAWLDVGTTASEEVADRTRDELSYRRALSPRHRPSGRRRPSGYVRTVLLAACATAVLIGLTYVIVSLLLSRQAL